METRSIMIVGVGGQGSLLASKILGSVFMSRGFDVKVSEVHGMSQRGGSVVTYVKYGSKVNSPVICPGEADVIVSFELLEAARWLPYLKKGGHIVMSTQKLDPMPVITGAEKYPEDIEKNLRDLGADVISADALALAEEAGSAKASNVVLMGLLSTKMDIDAEVWTQAIKECVPEKFLQLNLKAFELGRSIGG